MDDEEMDDGWMDGGWMFAVLELTLVSCVGPPVGPVCGCGARTGWRLRWWVWTTMASCRCSTSSKVSSPWSLMGTLLICSRTCWSSSIEFKRL